MQAKNKKEGVLKIIADGRITLPKEARENWDVSDGDLVHYEYTGDAIKIRPVEISHKEVEKLNEISKEKGQTYVSGDVAKKAISDL